MAKRLIWKINTVKDVGKKYLINLGLLDGYIGLEKMSIFVLVCVKNYGLFQNLDTGKYNAN